jgi:hypothetical protein
MKMISKKYTTYVFSFFMALLMSCTMSLVISIFNVGLIEGIVSIWLKGWAFSFIVAFTTVIVVSPIVKKLVNLVIENNDENT